MRTVLLMILLVIASDRTAFSQVGSLQGRVVLDGGPALSGVKVSIRRIRERLPSRYSVVFKDSPFEASAITAGTGDFAFQNLPAGRYRVCAAGPAKAHLPTCRWRQAVVIAEVIAGRSTSGIAVNMLTGVPFSIVVQDSATGIRAGKRFQIGVFTDQNDYYGAVRSATSGADLTFSVVAPKSISLRLFADAEVNVINESGQPIPNRTPSQRIVLPPSGEAAVRLRVQ